MTEPIHGDRGPRFLFREHTLRCGYAPRTILLSRYPRSQEVFFVGCKDGSVTVVQPDQDQTDEPLGPKQFKVAYENQGETRTGVRSLVEWGEDALLLVRYDGSLTTLQWREATEKSLKIKGPRAARTDFVYRLFPFSPLSSDDSIHRYLLCGRRGLHLLEKSAPHLGRIQASYRLDSPVRFALPLGTADASVLWILIRQDGEIWTAEESQDGLEAPVRDCEISSQGQRPSLMSDYGLFRDDPSRESLAPAQAILLATDRGVFLLTHEESPRGGEDGTNKVKLRRLSLPGLGPMATALSFANDDSYNYLWLADSAGDSHLYWDTRKDENENLKPPQNVYFQRSGVYQAQSEVLLCFLWHRPAHGEEGSSLLIAEARRNDRIVIGQFSEPTQAAADIAKASHDQDVRLRALLVHGLFTPTEKDLRSGLQPFEAPKGKRGITAVRNYLLCQEATSQEEREELGGASDAAILAELFEYLAEDERRRRILVESLRAPYCQAAREILQNSSVGHEVTEMWTLTLLGILHRLPNTQSTVYLDLLQWLRNCQLEATSKATRTSLLQDIQFARKWGLHGDVNSDRRDLTEPIKILRDQIEARSPAGGNNESDDDLVSRLQLDLLTYETLLFRRVVSLVCEESVGRLRGRTAWDLAIKEVDGKTLVAVSWRWGGVEVYELKAPEDRRPVLTFLFALTPKQDDLTEFELIGGNKRDPTEIRQDKYGYSRIVQLGSFGGKAYMITAPTTDEAANQPGNRLLLWDLDRFIPLPPEEKGDSYRPDEIIELGERSVYSLLRLDDPRLLLLGTQGSEGRPRLTTLTWPDGSPLGQPHLHDHPLGGDTLTEATGGLPSSPTTTVKNRIWTQVLDRNSRRKSLIVGCESGEIFRLHLKPTAGPQPTFEGDDKPIARMRSAVLCLACPRRQDAEGKAAAGGTRVFAGTEDGSIVAWQQLGDERSFASVWATSEAAPVSSLHWIPPQPAQESPPMVLAVARSGQCVLINDGAPQKPKDHDGQPHRFTFPGNRHGRFRLGTGAFASLLLTQPVSSPRARKMGACMDLLVASEQGELIVSSAHAPYRSEARDKSFESIMGLWWRIVGEGHRLRVADAVYKATPVLSLILVRWLLDPGFEKYLPRSGDLVGHGPTDPPWIGNVGDPSFEEWWLPRHIRPLYKLRRLWDDFEATGRSPGGEVRQALSDALERAWRLDDLTLFKQICEVVLKRANFTIFSVDPRDSEDKKQALLQLYTEIYRSLEQMLIRWLGSAEDKEARARMIVAKHLVDGDTFFKLLQASGAQEADPFLEIFKLRKNAVRELVHKRHPTVSLEALRAANLSLQRLCRRLVDQRGASDESWFPSMEEDQASLQEAGWKVFESYFDELTTAAARTFRSPRELNDTLAHEYSRTFALCVIACPSAALRIASRITEKQILSEPSERGFREDLSYRVVRQLKVLRSLGLRIPTWVEEVFQLGSQPPTRGWKCERGNYPELLKRGVMRGERPAGSESEPCKLVRRSERHVWLGESNEEDLASVASLGEVVDKLTRLADKLKTNAQGIDLSAKWLQELTNSLPPIDSEFQHSSQFWKDSLGKARDIFVSKARCSLEIRPEAVLASRKIARWTNEIREDLTKRYKNGAIFQPEYTIFERALTFLHDNARDFPVSAAVQKNIVNGVLAHHLLEDLDEHIFELEEIAEVLDPLLVWKFRDGGRLPLAIEPEGGAPTARRFSTYLVRRAQSVESIPKNLRILRALGDSPSHEPEGQGAEGVTSFRDLLRQLQITVIEDRNSAAGDRTGINAVGVSRPEDLEVDVPKPNERERRHLALAVNELFRNGRKHSALAKGLQRRVTKPRAEPLKLRGIKLRFSFDTGEIGREHENYLRLRELRDQGIQAPLPPRRDRRVASTGAGLYLANLAASIVGWRLSIPKEFPRMFTAPLAECEFHLEKAPDSP